MDIGVTFQPAAYERYEQLGAVPAFCRVFAKPGSGLPDLAGRAVAGLPTGCLPWISHKDTVELSRVSAMWAELAVRYPGQRLRWTYYHESAPMDDTARMHWRAYTLALADLAGRPENRHIEIVQIQTNYAMRWRPDTDWSDWILPGITLGFDCYPLDGYRYESPVSMFALAQHAAASFGIRSWGVPELGADIRTGQSRARWLRQCVAHLRRVRADFVGLWGAGDRYEPTDEPTMNAFKRIAAKDFDARQPNRVDPDDPSPVGHDRTDRL